MVRTGSRRRASPERRVTAAADVVRAASTREAVTRTGSRRLAVDSGERRGDWAGRAGAARSNVVPASRRTAATIMMHSRPSDSGVKCRMRRREIHRANEGTGLLGAVLAIHSNVFPPHRERAVVASRVQRADDFLEVDAAPAERSKLPEPVRMTKREMSTEHAGRLGAIRPTNVLHVDMVGEVG